MNAVETIRAALADARNRPWIGAGPSFGAPHPAYLNSVVEDVDHDDAATICRDTETGDARYIAACNPEAMTAVLAHIDAQAAEIERLKADCEALQLALEVERDAANLYAKRVAHWIEKHDALLAQQLASEDRAQRDAEHLAELRAYELTVANLREQLAQRGEPVAWKWRFADGDLSESPFESRSECERDAVGYDGEAIPLYTHPQAPQVPMTDEQITRLLDRVRIQWVSSPPTYEAAPAFARAIEAHHNIKERP